MKDPEESQKENKQSDLGMLLGFGTSVVLLETFNHNLQNISNYVHRIHQTTEPLQEQINDLASITNNIQVVYGLGASAIILGGIQLGNYIGNYLGRKIIQYREKSN